MTTTAPRPPAAAIPEGVSTVKAERQGSVFLDYLTTTNHKYLVKSLTHQSKKVTLLLSQRM